MSAVIIVDMSPAAYLFSISRATDADTLHYMRNEIVADDSLSPEEKEVLMTAINRRFGRLNHLAVGKQTPRWK